MLDTIFHTIIETGQMYPVHHESSLVMRIKLSVERVIMQCSRAMKQRLSDMGT